jgi:hypothetical protein
MATTGTTEAKEEVKETVDLAPWAKITIREQTPYPPDKVEVTPHAGRIFFQNEDPVEYRIRFWKPGTDSSVGIDLLLPAAGHLTLLIKKDDAFSYSVMHTDSENAMTGKGGGPVTN